LWVCQNGRAPVPAIAAGMTMALLVAASVRPAGFWTNWFMGLWRLIGLTLPVSRIRLESNSEFRM
jgi:hypothetical protein